MRHPRHDMVSLELGKRIAVGLPEHPEWIDLARENLERWTVRNSDSPSLLRCYDEWRALLRRPIEDIAAVLTSDTDEGQRLRQNSPFVGALSPRVVWEIKRQKYASTSA